MFVSSPYFISSPPETLPAAGAYTLFAMNDDRKAPETRRRMFTARARGLLAPGFVLLDRDGGELGQLRTRGLAGAELRGTTNAAVERVGRGYRMLAGGETLLTARLGPRPEGGMEISSRGRTYAARINTLRNTAVARAPDGTVVELGGNLTGRRYEATAEAEEALPVAVFLLYYLAAVRRRAYLSGRPAKAAKSP